jgi:hypothetical protein
MRSMNDDLTDPWDRFESRVDRHLHNVSVFISETFNWAISRYLGQFCDPWHSWVMTF